MMNDDILKNIIEELKEWAKREDIQIPLMRYYGNPMSSNYDEDIDSAEAFHPGCSYILQNQPITICARIHIPHTEDDIPVLQVLKQRKRSDDNAINNEQ